MSVALIGLIGIQLYWVNNAINLKEEQFMKDVNGALHRVVERLEKGEALEKLQSHQAGRFLFFENDTISGSWENLADTSFQYFVMKDVQKRGDKIEIKITEEQHGKRVSKIINKDLAKGDTVTNEELYETGLKFAPDTTPESKSAELKIKSRLENKSAFVGDIVKSLIQVNLFEKMEERINRELLDSLLSEELKNGGITTEYDFGVFDMGEKLLFASEEKSLEKLSPSDLQIRLFPNDIIENAHFLKIYFPNQKTYLLKAMWMMLIISVLLIGAIIFTFSYTLTTIIKQKKLAEIKNDFINNMTHELKTPVSTISLACEALKDPEMVKNEKILSRYINMIEDENKRLGTMVQNVLQSAVWDKGDFELKKEEFDIHKLIKDVAEKTEIFVRENQGEIILNLDAGKSIISADRIHLTNVIFNLLDNAIKYSPVNPKITIRTENKETEINISVQDNGIGIRKEDQKKIFEKLYRVPTGNIHNVKGFGLGLNYVKTIVEKHGGSVKVESEIGKGSCFEVRLPNAQE